MKVSKVIYVYKYRQYDELPLKYYYISIEEDIGDTKYIHIKRRVPMFIHILFIILALVPLTYLNIASTNLNTVQVRDHTLRIPNEMYYDLETNTIDIDIANDDSNFESINITLISPNGIPIIQLFGILPGESVGSYPTDFRFASLPAKCTLVYESSYKNFVFKNIERSILVVDRSITDKLINHNF